MLHFPVISALADNLEMWDMAPEAGDSVVKPLAKPEPPQTAATPVPKNQMVTRSRTPQSLCHENPRVKPGPWHLQAHNVNQHTTGSNCFRNENWRENLGLILWILKDEWHLNLRSWIESCQRNRSVRKWKIRGWPGGVAVKRARSALVAWGLPVGYGTTWQAMLW